MIYLGAAADVTLIYCSSSCFVGSLSRGSKKGVFLVLKLRVSISSKVDHDSLVSSKMEKPR